MVRRDEAPVEVWGDRFRGVQAFGEDDAAAVGGGGHRAGAVLGEGKGPAEPGCVPLRRVCVLFGFDAPGAVGGGRAGRLYLNPVQVARHPLVAPFPAQSLGGSEGGGEIPGETGCLCDPAAGHPAQPYRLFGVWSRVATECFKLPGMKYAVPEACQKERRSDGVGARARAGVCSLP
jgi:hypothetical protein